MISCMSEIVHYSSFSDCFISLNTMFSSSIHILTRSWIFFFLWLNNISSYKSIYVRLYIYKCVSHTLVYLSIYVYLTSLSLQPSMITQAVSMSWPLWTVLWESLDADVSWRQLLHVEGWHSPTLGVRAFVQRTLPDLILGVSSGSSCASFTIGFIIDPQMCSANVSEAF